ncbi:hypothetical protein BH23ACT12_BH23ACT12_00750 [soil metagenome]
MDRTQELGIQRPAERGRGSTIRILLLVGLLAALTLVPADRRLPDAAPEGTEAQPIPPSPAPELLPTSDLIYRVPAAIRTTCVPFDHGDLPIETLECAEGLSRAFYTRYATVAAMDAHFDELTAPFNLPVIPGGCRAGIPSRDEWHYTHSPTRVEGRMACWLLPENAPVTMVTQPEQRLISVVISNPALGWPGHHLAWATRVPNPPSERQPPQPAAGEV